MKFPSVGLCLLASASSLVTVNAFSSFIRQAPMEISQRNSNNSFSPRPLRREASIKNDRSFKLRMVANAVVPEEDASEAPVGTGTASMSNMIFNLVKSVVGAGVLSLPAGIGAFGNAPSAVLPATVLIAIFGGLSGYAFSLLGRVCAYTGALSYREAWSKTVGEETSIIPAASCTFKTSVAILAYSMILADTGKALFSTVGVNISRSNTLFGITGAFLLPLCLLKNLASLAPFSLLGVVGMGYTCIAMIVRFFGGAYKVPSGALLPGVASALQPSFGSKGAMSVFDPKSFILISMLSTAFMAHFNAPKFYVELKDNTIKRYNILVTSSFAISTAIFAAIAGAGFLTFGSASSGLILNNYANKDILMSLSRVAVAISLVFSYPLIFSGCRDGFLDLANVPVEKRTNSLLNKVTVGILTGVTGLALVLKDLTFVLSFGGATLGNALIYVYPALMFRKAVQNMGDKASKGLKREVNFALGTAGLGVAMGVVGAKMALKSLFA
uniref:Amino acid transporter transmembrane domain-containing protein n=1 Tax=Eucampia antarctica TaxID=49252 RepID=A0A7S2R064_9STRA|mmetsp:Transcript_1102/g.1013  ORF Transcript_1102/g.1013 Transcript_1102/m.1013 type:complete len:499 (+) Transcript_1102:35-1531(+)|eukprot:CAMPEP_0197827632 /NCGR_PEP_ID=MMETSP1437-20131217/4370_1 /TAXON_ID=49252 ORGANISM="Eucampia antarctica, Strain CCMP1452" /NCGR_SAMPLE_ID=MMETSP1437 /ASSEMBLY_ACC=CAM_ASM_001096 /LENGTH=498 /DNA_ID=CAMNT_0043428557 /DNA_START=20 /DNA_END=1516 /DNA_ORIENTATION=+